MDSVRGCQGVASQSGRHGNDGRLAAFCCVKVLGLMQVSAQADARSDK